MLVSILAVLKASYAYVPIGIEWPAERVEYLLKDTKTKLLLTNESLKKKLQAISQDVMGETSVEFCAVDSFDTQLELKKQSTENLEKDIHSQHLAYVIYTSGTTGMPKGVLIEHKGVVNLVAQNKKLLQNAGLSERKLNSLWHSNYVFDAHVWDLTASVFQGHTLHLIQENMRTDLPLLAHYIEKEKIDFLALIPGLLNTEIILNLKLVVMGGINRKKKS